MNGLKRMRHNRRRCVRLDQDIQELKARWASFEGEIHALRAALDYLEALLEETPEDAERIRVTAAMYAKAGRKT